MMQKYDTIVLQVDGGTPTVEISFGHAHVGNYTCNLWDQNGEDYTKLAKLAHGNNVDNVKDTFHMEYEPNYLNGLIFSYEAIIQAAENRPGQQYSLTITVRQQGDVCKDGVIHDTGTLDDTKSIIGFRRFRTE